MPRRRELWPPKNDEGISERSQEREKVERTMSGTRVFPSNKHVPRIIDFGNDAGSKHPGGGFSGQATSSSSSLSSSTSIPDAGVPTSLTASSGGGSETGTAEGEGSRGREKEA